MAGGDGGLHVPKEIWSPAGGFYADPRKWKRNTFVVAGAIALAAAYIFSKSTQMEERHATPTRPIPSQKWAPKSFPQ
ncbi:hypothetical protein Ndes2526B_g06343 [Nannochloris sp. 'desiccata']|nr:hypothetical protein KSW81_008110 [Chlorella desiccata (nom. nud.)]KAH7619371.1 hypothetical protein NADE_006214 [Chlorella desiccata (nom. nud.)]